MFGYKPASKVKAAQSRSNPFMNNVSDFISPDALTLKVGEEAKPPPTESQKEMKTFMNLRASLITRNRFISKPRYNTLELMSKYNKFNASHSKMEVQSGHDVSSGLEMPVIHEVQGKAGSVKKL